MFEAMILRPASCQGCTKPAQVFLTLVSGGKAETYGCCEGCPTLESGPTEGAFLPSLALGLKLAVPAPLGRGKCPACGFRWSDFERIHRMGCPACYESHAPQALTTIARIQPGLAHQGRRPFDAAADRLARLTKAKDALKAALKEEDYEAAAVLRDQINELEAGKLEGQK
jgi:protein-arginine kinase activator protein McsA